MAISRHDKANYLIAAQHRRWFGVFTFRTTSIDRTFAVIVLLSAVALLLLISVVVFVKVAIFDRRPQKTGLLYALLSAPLFLVYYADRWPAAWGELPMRRAAVVLERFQGADINFVSDAAPAFIIGGLLLVHLIVLQRVAVRKKLEKLQNPIANFFSSAILATLVGGIIVSTFHWGWVGSILVGVAYTLIYLGVLALLAAVLEIVVELAKLILVWLKRQAFAIATMITRGSSFVSSLAGRLGLTSMADRLRAARTGQEQTFLVEQDRQDKELFEAFLRDRASQRRMAGRSKEEVDAEIAALSTSTQDVKEELDALNAVAEPAPNQATA